VDFKLITLGVSSASPMSDRFPSAHVLEVHGRLFLLDCGEGAQMLLAKHGISYFKISDVCISHLHGDHVFGLFGLLSTMSMKGRTMPLTIHAPEGLDVMLNFYRDRFGDGLMFKISHVRSDLGDITLLADYPDMELYSFPLNHSLPCRGYLVREKAVTLTYKAASPRSFAYCCDTAPFSQESRYLKGVNLLLHEATFANDLETIAALRGHSTSGQAARVAAEAEVGKLVITHFSSRYRDPEILLNQVKEHFENAFCAKEGAVFEV